MIRSMPATPDRIPFVCWIPKGGKTSKSSDMATALAGIGFLERRCQLGASQRPHHQPITRLRLLSNTYLPRMDSSVAESPADRFDYMSHWYPLSTLEDLDPTRPTAVELLGRRYVIWKPTTTTATSNSHFRVFRDHCPHRLAPPQ